MTKIYALSGETKEGEEKISKGSESQPVIHPSFLPVTLPITSIVAKKNKCKSSYMIAAVLLLWTIATVAIVFHVAPDTFYRRLYHTVAESEATVVPPVAQPYVLDSTEQRIYPESKVAIQQGSTIVDNDNSEEKPATNIDNDVSSEPLRNKQDAMKAIITLLSMPDIQQVAVIQSSGRSLQSGFARDDIPYRGMPQNPRFMPIVISSNDMEWALYKRAFADWQMRRELYRRHMLQNLEKDQSNMGAVPPFMMDSNQDGEFQMFSWHPYMYNRMPMGQMPSYHMMPMPMHTHMMQPRQIMQQIPPFFNNVLPNPNSNSIAIQQPQQQQIPHHPTAPNQMQQRDVIPQNYNGVIEVPNGLMPPAERWMIEEDKAAFQKQKPAGVPEINVDRDAIFKELRAQSEMRRMSGGGTMTSLPVQPFVNMLQPPAAMLPITTQQRDPDEIFKELQQRALKLQIDQDRRDAVAREKAQDENINNGDVKAPIVMIEDTFPRMTDDENKLESTVGSDKDGDKLRNSSEPITTYYKFFEHEAKNPESELIPTEMTGAVIQQTSTEAQSSEKADAIFGQSQPAKNPELVTESDNVFPRETPTEGLTSTATPNTVEYTEGSGNAIVRRS